MPSTSTLLAEYFGPIMSVPCWNVTAEYGSWLRLNFGAPRPAPREGQGTSELWIEMAAWEIHDEHRKLFHSNQARSMLRRAAVRLEGLALLSVQLSPGLMSTDFEFSDGTLLQTKPTERESPDEPLWHLYTDDRCLSYLTNNQLEYGGASGARAMSILARSAQHAA
jgi:hypothetical protein